MPQLLKCSSEQPAVEFDGTERAAAGQSPRHIRMVIGTSRRQSESYVRFLLQKPQHAIAIFQEGVEQWLVYVFTGKASQVSAGCLGRVANAELGCLMISGD